MKKQAVLAVMLGGVVLAGTSSSGGDPKKGQAPDGIQLFTAAKSEPKVTKEVMGKMGIAARRVELHRLGLSRLKEATRPNEKGVFAQVDLPTVADDKQPGTVLAVFNEMDEPLPGVRVWTGYVKAYPKTSSVSLSMKADGEANTLLCFIRTPKAVYDIFPDPGKGPTGQYIVRKVQESRVPGPTSEQRRDDTPPAGKKKPNSPQRESRHDPEPSAPSAPSAFTAAIQPPAQPVVDLMVLYSPQALQQAKAENNSLDQTLGTAVTKANGALRHSKVNLKLRVVWHGAVQYQEPNTLDVADDYWTMRENLKNPRDGQMDHIHALRNQVHADVVCLFVARDSNYSGMSYLMKKGDDNPGFADRAFCVVCWKYAAGYFTLMHEIGHVLGCNHNCPDGSNNPVRPDAFGFRWQDGQTQQRYLTIMALPWSDGDNSIRIERFSNPGLNFLGQNVGIPGQADNVRNLATTAGIVAAFR